MGEVVRLVSEDGGSVLDAWREPPREARRGGLVVLPAIWGVTPHLRALAAEWAEAGWDVVVPSLLDSGAAGFPDADRDARQQDRREAMAAATGWGDATTSAVQAAVDAVAAGGGGPVCVMGFCFGGTAAWLAACRCTGVAAVSAFYGGHVARFLDETPTCPVILHFGRRDPLIPPQDVAAVTAAHPETPAYLYDAGHAFVAPATLHADSARLAMLRTRALFHRAAGGRDHGA